MLEPARSGWGTPVSPARHAFLRVDACAYGLALRERAELANEALLIDWAALSRPLIARRRTPRDAPGLVPMGIALPPSHGKKRIALQLAPAAVLTLEPPPPLNAGAPMVPDAWRATIEAIVELGARVGVEVRAFGAVAWSALTGLDYLSSSSDLDLLFPLTPQAPVRALLDGLTMIEAKAPMRLDGEIIRENLGAVHWRELSSGAGEVLIKSLAGAAMGRRDAFLGYDDGHHGETKDWLAAS